jgi:hypothetical protein
MFALMFDFQFKSLRVVENYVGHGACIRRIIEHDVNVIISFLMSMFKVLNLIVQTCVIKVVGFVTGSSNSIEEENNIFGVGASMGKSSCALIVGELSLFKRLFVTLVSFVDTLPWW